MLYESVYPQFIGLKFIVSERLVVELSEAVKWLHEEKLDSDNIYSGKIDHLIKREQEIKSAATLLSKLENREFIGLHVHIRNFRCLSMMTSKCEVGLIIVGDYYALLASRGYDHLLFDKIYER